MAEVFKIPLSNVPQKFSISLSNMPLVITCKYNNVGICWMLQISDGNTEEALTGFFPLVTGTDLLRQLPSLGIPGELWVYTDGNAYAVPSLDNLGVEANLYYVTE